MKVFKKVLKWSGISLISLLLLIVLAGLIFNWASPAPHSAKGELVDVGGFRLHIISEGEKNDKPTLVIEGGGGLPTEFGYWLSEGVKDSMRVIRYDRAGIGHSDPCVTPRDPETIARELHTLLEKSGESPPYIMMGHSIGGPFIRVFTELYPDEVAAMFFLDATHPDQVVRYNAPTQNSFIYKAYMWSLGAQAVLCDLGILYLYDQLWGTPYFGEGLPEEENNRIKSFLRAGKIFRAYKQEMLYYYDNLKRSGAIEDFGNLPIRSFNAVPEKVERADAKAEEPAPEDPPKAWPHKEYYELSSNAKHILITGNHVTIFTKQENAAIICQELMQVMADLRSKDLPLASK